MFAKDIHKTDTFSKEEREKINEDQKVRKSLENQVNLISKVRLHNWKRYGEEKTDTFSKEEKQKTK